jgi:23S rRNA (guanosine2251-2'-O)-methyltransferase
MSLQLRNPHSVLAVFKARPDAVVELRLSDARPSGAWADVAALAARHRVPVLRQASPADRRARPDAPGRRGTSEATVKEKPGVELNELFASASENPREAALWLALEGIQDPHNVGAVFRSAAFFGVRGIVVTRDRSVPLNATVYDVASGGIECVPFSVQTNLVRAIESAKKAGLWVLGSSEHARDDLAGIDRGRPWLLVLGNEEKGLRRLTLEHCDQICRLTPKGKIGSLNVSVAAGVLMAALTGATQ